MERIPRKTEHDESQTRRWSSRAQAGSVGGNCRHPEYATRSQRTRVVMELWVKYKTTEFTCWLRPAVAVAKSDAYKFQRRRSGERRSMGGMDDDLHGTRRNQTEAPGRPLREPLRTWGNTRMTLLGRGGREDTLQTLMYLRKMERWEKKKIQRRSRRPEAKRTRRARSGSAWPRCKARTPLYAGTVGADMGWALETMTGCERGSTWACCHRWGLCAACRSLP